LAPRFDITGKRIDSGGDAVLKRAIIQNIGEWDHHDLTRDLCVMGRAHIWLITADKYVKTLTH
jgi:hypothetical protein